MAYQVRKTVYRDNAGYSVTGSKKGESGFPVSIFVRCRSTAVRIRKVLNAGLPFEQRAAKIDLLIHADSRVKVCRR